MRNSGTHGIAVLPRCHDVVVGNSMLAITAHHSWSPPGIAWGQGQLAFKLRLQLLRRFGRQLNLHLMRGSLLKPLDTRLCRFMISSAIALLGSSASQAAFCVSTSSTSERPLSEELPEASCTLADSRRFRLHVCYCYGTLFPETPSSGLPNHMPGTSVHAAKLRTYHMNFSLLLQSCSLHA